MKNYDFNRVIFGKKILSIQRNEISQIIKKMVSSETDYYVVIYKDVYKELKKYLDVLK